MFLKQYYLGCLAHASYMIADERTGVAAVIDPQRDIDQYLEDAKAKGWKIQYVFLTHFHADFLAGHIELNEETGAHIYLGERAEAEYDFTAVKDGDVVEFGDVRLKIMETPGHTPEGISILVYDLLEDDRNPHAVLTGDTMFIGDVGRPDLLASIGVTADELSDMLYDSVNRLKELPDEVLVYPAHGAGSMCGKSLSEETYSTIGDQKKFNYALKPMSRERFKELVTADQMEAPKYFVHDAILNRKERKSLDETMKASLKPMTLEEVLQQQKNGAQLVDVRNGNEYEGAHILGATNIALEGMYATWSGTLLSHEAPIVVVAEDGGEEEAIMRLGRIGFDNVVGFLKGSMAAVGDREDVLARTSLITSPALAVELESSDPPMILDVRSEQEWKCRHINGSTNIPLPHLRERSGELPRDRSIVVHCKGGYRSVIAASLLEQAGFEDVFDLVGGLKGWEASALPTDSVDNELATCSA